MRATMAWTGLALTGAGVAGYWAYTLLGVERLGPLMLRPRRLATGAGAALAGASLVGLPRPSVLIPVALTGGLVAYSVRNQWLIPRPAPSLVPSARPLDPGDLLAVLPGQGAVPLRWAARLRTARVGSTLLVHCGLARSLTAFGAPDAPVAAVLPHASGFDIATADRRWDGVDGTPRDGGPPLPRTAVRLVTRADYDGVILAPPGDPAPPRPHHRRPRIPGARGIADPMAWGIVERDRWIPLGDGSPADAGGDAYYLGRWAAHRRAL